MTELKKKCAVFVGEELLIIIKKHILDFNKHKNIISFVKTACINQIESDRLERIGNKKTL